MCQNNAGDDIPALMRSGSVSVSPMSSLCVTEARRKISISVSFLLFVPVRLFSLLLCSASHLLPWFVASLSAPEISSSSQNHTFSLLLSHEFLRFFFIILLLPLTLFYSIYLVCLSTHHYLTVSIGLRENSHHF